MTNDSKVMMGVDLASEDSQSVSVIFEVEKEGVRILDSGPVRCINKMKPLAVSLMPYQQKFLDELRDHEGQDVRLCFVLGRRAGFSTLREAVRDIQRPSPVDDTVSSFADLSPQHFVEVFDALAYKREADLSPLPKYRPIRKSDFFHQPVWLSKIAAMAKVHGEQLNSKLGAKHVK